MTLFRLSGEFRHNRFFHLDADEADGIPSLLLLFISVMVVMVIGLSMRCLLPATNQGIFLRVAWHRPESTGVAFLPTHKSRPTRKLVAAAAVAGIRVALPEVKLLYQQHQSSPSSVCRSKIAQNSLLGICILSLSLSSSWANAIQAGEAWLEKCNGVPLLLLLLSVAAVVNRLQGVVVVARLRTLLFTTLLFIVVATIIIEQARFRMETRSRLRDKILVLLLNTVDVDQRMPRMLMCCCTT
jgi:hypothetical protein